MVAVLEATANPFRGILPTPKALPEDPEIFRQRLQHSLQVWTASDYVVVWLEIPLSRAALIPVAVAAGFTFHHSSPTYLMLTHCLVEGAFVPPYATHYIGAGGVVINARCELLVVSERYRAQRGPSYKLPGGALHPGEHLVDGVIREVLEETGVQTRFDALACFRHWHGYRYGKSDIYFVCRLSPLSQEISMQADEIAECLWMPVDTFLHSTDVHTFNKEIVRAALESHGLAPSLIEGFPDDGKREFFMPTFRGLLP
jgi:8-oxo-dGTP pyrophosphatase MutT (NUDIX family)